MERKWYVYILASKKDGVLYIGITNDLLRRTYEHKEAITPSFTKHYFVRRLVYYEIYDDPESAIHREKCLKKWNRAWKIELIEQENPQWMDLYETII